MHRVLQPAGARRVVPSTMMSPRLLATVLSLVAFGAIGCDSKDAAKEPAPAADAKAKTDTKTEAKPKAEAPKEVPEPKWSTVAIEPTSVEVDGQKVKVSVPKDLKLELKPAKDSFPGYANWTWPHSFDGPSFTVREVSMPRDLAAAVNSVEVGNKYKATHQEEIDGGFLVAAIEDTKKYIHVVHTKKGPADKWYQYSVMQRTREPIADIEALQVWMIAAVKTLAFE